MSVESSLQQLGFSLRGDRTIRAPSGARVKLIPLDEDRFFQLRIETKHAAVVMVVAANAIKVEAVKP
jgi:hypothetical protein